MAGSTLSTVPRLVRHDQPIVRASVVTAAATILFAGGNSFNAANAPGVVWYWRPSDYDVYDRATELRLALELWTGAVIPGNNLYATLFAVTSVAGSGTTHAVTLGAEVAAARTNTVALAAASTSYFVHQTFPAPAEGWYATALVFDAAMAANSHIDCSGGLDASNA